MKYGLALIALVGCLDAGDPLTSTADDLSSQNGLSLNGLSLNGLSLNGLSLNGLSLNGLSTASFATWFATDPTNHAAQMAYVVKCAKATGTTTTWTDPVTSVSYSWPGELGLATAWSSGSAMTVAEQQVMSACMIAHANKYGIHIPIAVEGRTATGVEIARDTNELTTYSFREAAFFGNTITGEGAFVCLDHAPLTAQQSTARACALDSIGTGLDAACPPIVYAGPCAAICTADATKTYYTSCTVNSHAYVPVVTRLQPASIYSCGDGVCEISEHCGSGATANSCKADCGLCPLSSASLNAQRL
jgi:hypothetical protein